MTGRILLFVVFTFLFATRFSRSETSEEWIFPIVVNGPVEASYFQTTFVFFNQTATAQQLAVAGMRDQFGGNSQLFCPPQIDVLPPVDRRLEQAGLLPASGLARFTSSGESIELFTGWARVKTDRPELLTASAEISILKGEPQSCVSPALVFPPRIPVIQRRSPDFLQTVVIPAVRPQREFQYEAVITGARETAFSIVNPSLDEPATVRFELLDETGSPLASNSGEPGANCPPVFGVLPGERLVGLAWTLYAAERLEFLGSPPCVTSTGERPQFYSGTARISSDRPIAVSALHLVLPEGLLVSAPVASRE